MNIGMAIISQYGSRPFGAGSTIHCELSIGVVRPLDNPFGPSSSSLSGKKLAIDELWVMTDERMPPASGARGAFPAAPQLPVQEVNRTEAHEFALLG